MIVDDFEPWRSFVSATLLKEPNLQIVCEVADAVEAIGEANKIQPNLILLDIGLPSLNGRETAQQIFQIAPRSRILFAAPDHIEDGFTRLCPDELQRQRYFPPAVAFNTIVSGVGWSALTNRLTRNLWPSLATS
jgi:CheY-like chemotaxis protein